MVDIRAQLRSKLEHEGRSVSPGTKVSAGKPDGAGMTETCGHLRNGLETDLLIFTLAIAIKHFAKTGSRCPFGDSPGESDTRFVMPLFG